jgi:hypothetical protein
VPPPFDPFDPNAPPDTLFTGASQPQFPRLNLPGFGQMGPMVGGLAQMGIQAFLGDQGLAALQFGGTQNIMDTYRARQQFHASQRALELGAQQDALRMRSMMEGAARMSGADEAYLRRGDVQDAIGRLSNTGQMLIPFLARAMPETLDRMFGTRGSQAVLGYEVFQGGRFRTDPVTGMVGYSPETSGHVARRLFEDLYGNDNRMLQMKGLGAGEAGLLFDEMSRRGMFGGGASFGGVGGGPGGPGGKPEPTAIREGEVTRIRDRLRDMTGAVAAMREVFGDAGHPDAPMRQLVEGLQALTQGSMTQVDPSHLKMMVRQTQELARMAGVDVASVFQMTARGAGLADQLGLARPFAAQATQGALAYAQAFNNLGLGVTGFGALDKDAAVAADQQLRLQGARSPMANVLAAAVAMENMFGGGAGFKGSELAKIAQAARAGDTAALSGLTPERLADMAASAGIDRGTAWSLYASPESTRQFALQYGLGDVARSMQRQDVNFAYLNPAMSAAFNRFGARGAGLAAKAAEAFWQSDLDKFAKGGGSRLDAIMTAMGDLGEGVDAGQVRQALAAGLANFEQVSGQQATAVRQLHDPRLAAETRRMSLIAQRRGALADAVAGVGRGGILRNLVDFAMEAGPDATLRDFIVRVGGGGVTQQRLADALGAPGAVENGPGREFLDKIREYNKLLADPTVTEEQLEGRRQELQKLGGGLLGAFEKNFTTNERAAMRLEPLPAGEAASSLIKATGAAGGGEMQARLASAIRGLSRGAQGLLRQNLAAYAYAQELASGQGLFDIRQADPDQLAQIQAGVEAKFGVGSFGGVDAIKGLGGTTDDLLGYIRRSELPGSEQAGLDDDKARSVAERLGGRGAGRDRLASALLDLSGGGRAKLMKGLEALEYYKDRLGGAFSEDKAGEFDAEVAGQFGVGAPDLARKLAKAMGGGELSPEALRREFGGAGGEGTATVKLDDQTKIKITFDETTKIRLTPDGLVFSGGGVGGVA